MKRQTVAAEISYASSAQSRAGRFLVRAMENVTGRVKLVKRAEGFAADVTADRDFWQVMLDRYRLSLQLTAGSLRNIPANGPLILVANHPYGLLDGLMMGHILSQTRGDFRILANHVFCQADAVEKSILPISFESSKDAMRLNIQTRSKALEYLRANGAIGIFPGGTVSTSAQPMSKPMDPSWRNFTAKLVVKSGATVVPVYFEGSNSRLFQIASHLHVTLRLGLLIKEFHRRVGTPVHVTIGAPIPQTKLAQHAMNSNAMMDFLRKATYDLSQEPMPTEQYGFEFEEKYKAKAV